MSEAAMLETFLTGNKDTGPAIFIGEENPPRMQRMLFLLS
jgi:hypothetical protein